MTELDPRLLAFLAGGAYTLVIVVATVWVLDKVDSWWGHREYRRLEARSVSKKDLEDARGEEIGFHA